jgi:hypothetical protein
LLAISPAPSIGLIVVQLVLIALAAAAGAFFGEYFKTKGKNLATKQDFEDLKDQLRANTELVERVKAEIGREDWASREWTNLRRLKLEELLEKAHAGEANLKRARYTAITADVQLDDAPLEALQTIQVLYLPELKDEAERLVRSHQTCLQACGNLGILAMRKRTDMQLSAEYDKALSETMARYRETLVPLRELRTAARTLLMNVLKVS